MPPKAFTISFDWQDIRTYVSVQLLGRISAQGRNVQDMILIGLTSSSRDATEQKISGRINVRLFSRSHSSAEGKHSFLIFKNPCSILVYQGPRTRVIGTSPVHTQIKNVPRPLTCAYVLMFLQIKM